MVCWTVSLKVLSTNYPSNHSYGIGCYKVMVVMVISMDNVMNTLMLHACSVAMLLLDLYKIMYCSVL